MSYTYEIDVKALFTSRTEQFIAFGIPEADVLELQPLIMDMWTDAPGGWPYEWSVLAGRYLKAGNPFLASIAYGYAKFPCLADEARRKALDNQLSAYLAAATDFPVNFERRLLALPYCGENVELPVHLFSHTGRFHDAPVLICSGGIDTYKMDCHQLCVTLAQRLNITVLGFDMPGTAESPVPLSNAGDELILSLVQAARQLGNGQVAHFGLSFGGNFSAMTGLSGAVDAAIVVGGPVDQSFDVEHIRNLPFRTADIIGNDMGFDQQPNPQQLRDALSLLARRPLLDRKDNAPMLIINGSDDDLVPQSDTLVFEGRANTEVHLLPNTGHCAVSKLGEVLDIITQWLSTQLSLN